MECTYDGLGVFGAGGTQAEFAEGVFSSGGDGVKAAFGGLGGGEWCLWRRGEGEGRYDRP